MLFFKLCREGHPGEVCTTTCGPPLKRGDRGIGRELRERKSHSHLFHAPRKLQTYPGPYLIWTQQGADLVEMFGQNDTSVLETPKRAMAKVQ